MGKNDNTIVTYAEGQGRNFARAKNKKCSWKEFCRIIGVPTKTKERRSQYDKLNHQSQVELKSVDGWISTAPCKDNKRKKANILPRDLMSLDLDYPDEDVCTMILAGFTEISGFEFAAHSSRSHTDESPRLRVFLPMARSVDRDEYGPLVRIVAQLFDPQNTPIKQVDVVSSRPAQMMFKPTTSIDGDWFYYRNEGVLLDPDELFDQFTEEHGDWHDIANLPTFEGEKKLHQRADKAEDPLTKKGPIGDFCRAYDIESAMAQFIPDIYEPTDDGSADPRFTYLGATTANGAVIYDEGRFLYSHHGSDPLCDILANAFDMVRVHLFGEEDDGTDEDTPPSQMPSYKAMLEHISDDEEYIKARQASRYDTTTMFERLEPEDEDDDEDMLADMERLIESAPAEVSPTTSPKKKKRSKKPPTDWFHRLELDKHGAIKPTLTNLTMIITNDPRFWGAIAYNEFTGQIVCKKGIVEPRIDTVPPFHCKDPVNGDRWQDINDATIRNILEAPNGDGKAGYGMSISDRNMRDAVLSAAYNNKIHPVRDYLDDLEWDGVERVDRYLIHVLNCPDTIYHREISRWALVASVTRIYEPGHKFDYGVIMTGLTGVRKSGMLLELYGENWFGELEADLGNKQRIAEEMAGKWCGELPELTAFTKSDHNTAKAFMRRTHDDVRMAYDRHVRELPRQQVYWGSTNDHTYLKDPTGNRSYWPVDVIRTEKEPIPTWWIKKHRDQIWAEAVVKHRAMRQKRPVGILPLTLQSDEAKAEALEKQEEARLEELHEVWVREIVDWLEEPVKLTQFLNEINAPRGEQFSEDAEKLMVVRTAFTAGQAQLHALNKPTVASDYQMAANIGKALHHICERIGWRKRLSITGKDEPTRVHTVRGRWFVRDDATDEEIKLGYRVVENEDEDESDNWSRLI